MSVRLSIVAHIHTYIHTYIHACIHTHNRMIGRTVVIGDVPWVAQSIEAYLSKLFAVSYSATSLSVLSANPTDHLVHRYACLDVCMYVCMYMYRSVYTYIVY